MINYFIFNGKDSRDFDIQLAEYPPMVKPRERIETITVPGRSGTLHIKEDENIFESYIKPFNIVALDPTRIDEIKEWLHGSGELIIGNEIDWIYDGYITEAIEFTRFYRGWHSATLNIEVQPFKKSRRIHTQALQSGNVDNYIQCDSKYPTPFVINMMDHPSATALFRINDLSIKTVFGVGETNTGWSQVISEKGIAMFQESDDPQSPVRTVPLVYSDQKAMVLEHGINKIKILKQCSTPTISYRKLTI